MPGVYPGGGDVKVSIWSGHHLYCSIEGFQSLTYWADLRSNLTFMCSVFWPKSFLRTLKLSISSSLQKLTSVSIILISLRFKIQHITLYTRSLADRLGKKWNITPSLNFDSAHVGGCHATLPCRVLRDTQNNGSPIDYWPYKRGQGHSTIEQMIQPK